MQFSALFALSVLVAACSATSSQPSIFNATSLVSPGSPDTESLDKRQLSCSSGFGLCPGDFCCQHSCCPGGCCLFAPGIADCCNDGTCCPPGSACIGGGKCGPR